MDDFSTIKPEVTTPMFKMELSLDEDSDESDEWEDEEEKVEISSELTETLVNEIKAHEPLDEPELLEKGDIVDNTFPQQVSVDKHQKYEEVNIDELVKSAPIRSVYMKVMEL